jgi:hypothetical protein
MKKTLSSICLVFILFAFVVSAITPVAAAISHPSLLFHNINETPGYQYRNVSPWKDWESGIIFSANSALSKNFSDSTWRISSKADASHDLALAYQITKNILYAEKAKEALLNLDIGDVPYKVDKAWALRSYSLAYDWIQPYLDSINDTTIRDKLATLADKVYNDLNDNGTNLYYISFADYHGQAYPTIGIAALALWDYVNPNNLPLSSSPSDWLKVATKYLFIKDELHKYNRSLFSFGFDESSGKHLNGAYKSYVIDDFIWWFQVYSYFFQRNIFDEYPAAKRAFTSEIWESMPNHYHNNFITSGNTKQFYHKGIINLLDDNNKSYALNHVDLIEKSTLLPYSSGTDYLPNALLYLIYGDYSSIPRKFPIWTSHLDKNSIYQVFRGSWADDSDWLSIITWNLTTNSNRNMAHHDQLSFEYFSRGDLLLADAGEDKHVLDWYYGTYDVHHNTISIENPRNPFPLAPYSNSPARGIYKGDAVGLETAAQIERIAQTSWIEFLEASANVKNVIGTSWSNKQLLSTPIQYKRAIIYPNKDYFIVIDRLEGSENWRFRNIFRPTSLSINPSVDTNNDGIYDESEVGNVKGNLTIGTTPFNWLSLPYKIETQTGIITNSIRWNTINPYGNKVYLHLFSAPSSEIRVTKHVGRIAGYDSKSEVFSPIVYFISNSTTDLYRVTVLLSRYNNESEKAPEELSVVGKGSAIKVSSSSYEDYIYTGRGVSSFGPISTNAETLYLRKTTNPSEYTLLNGSYINFSDTPLISLSKNADYLTLKKEENNITFKIKGTGTVNVTLNQINPGIFQVKRNGIIYTNWELTGNKMKITTDLGEHGEHEFEIKMIGQREQEIKFTYNLHSGWNLISLPVINSSFTAKSFTEAIKFSRSENLEVQFIVTCDLTGNYKQYIVGFSEDSDDFEIKPDYGYYIYLNNETTFSIYGTAPGQRNVDLKKGWNLIGWTSLNTTNASTLVHLSGNNIKYITMRNETTGEYQTYIAGLSREEDNFLIEPGRGYFVYAERDFILSYR